MPDWIIGIHQSWHPVINGKVADDCDAKAILAICPILTWEQTAASD